MIIKILLAICVLVLTVVSIGFKAVKTNEEIFYKRLRTPGYVGIVVAICIFILGSINEYNSSIEKKSLEDKIAILTSGLEDARINLNEVPDKLAISIQENINANEIIKLMDESSRGQLVRYKYSSIHYNDISAGSNDVISEDNEVIIPVNGDRIRWNVFCDGNISDLDEFRLESGKYGTFIASYYRNNINDRSGYFVFEGTKSTGGSLTFGFFDFQADRNRLELLKQSNCQIQIEVERELRSIQLSILDMRSRSYINNLSSKNSFLCEKYERLYPGSSCEDF